MSNQTIYVRNLSEKVKPEALKRALYLSFSTYGNIIEVHTPRTKRIRGQAWVVYDDSTGAVQAVANMNGKMFYNKPIEVSFAKEKSDIVARYEGTFVSKKDKKKQQKAASAISSSKGNAMTTSGRSESKGDSESLLGVKRSLADASEGSTETKAVKREGTAPVREEVASKSAPSESESKIKSE